MKRTEPLDTRPLLFIIIELKPLGWYPGTGPSHIMQHVFTAQHQRSSRSIHIGGPVGRPGLMLDGLVCRGAQSGGSGAGSSVRGGGSGIEVQLGAYKNGALTINLPRPTVPPKPTLLPLSGPADDKPHRLKEGWSSVCLLCCVSR